MTAPVIPASRYAWRGIHVERRERERAATELVVAEGSNAGTEEYRRKSRERDRVLPERLATVEPKRSHEVTDRDHEVLQRAQASRAG